MSAGAKTTPALGPQTIRQHEASQKKGLDHVAHLRDILSFENENSNVIGTLLEELAVPHRRTERWKYSPVGGFWKEHKPVACVTIADSACEAQPVPGLDAYRLVFVNGTFDPSASDLPIAAGVVCMPLSEAVRSGLVQREISSVERSDWFAALNGQFAGEGMYLAVEKAVELDRPVLIHQRQQGAGVPTFLRHVIELGAHAQAQVVNWSSASSDASGSVNTLTEVHVGEQAVFTLDKVQDESGEVHHLAFEAVDQAANSTFKIHTMTIQGAWVRNDLQICLSGQGCDAYLNGIFLPTGKEFVDNHTTVDHREAHCTSSESYKGILYGQSTGVFNGKVFVRPDAQQTNAYQQNANILGSRQATMNAKPELEIYADDVKCSHGCTIGQFDDEALFYARSRGIGEDEAKAMLVHAFIGDVIDGIAIPEVAMEVRHRLSEKHDWDRWDDANLL
jgi:Fe-S cluster assembly protein SufD